MKRSQLLEAFGDSIMSKVTINLSTGGEIEMTDDDPTLPEHHVVAFHAEAEIKSVKFEGDGRGRVILVIDRSSFEIDSVTAPPEPPATEPMLGPDGEVLIGDVVDKVVGEMAKYHDFAPDPESPAFCLVLGCDLAESEHLGALKTEGGDVAVTAARKKRKAKVDALPVEQVNEG